MNEKDKRIEYLEKQISRQEKLASLGMLSALYQWRRHTQPGD